MNSVKLIKITVIRYLLVLVASTLCIVPTVWGQQTGYSIQGGKVVIDAKEQWAQWEQVAKTMQITDEGVRPAFIRKSSIIEIDGQEVVVPGVNTVLNAAELAGGGIRAAGTNAALAANLMDGRMDTYWGPDLNDPMEDWWVQIDLGRAVSAQKIVLKFVGEELGDPFLQFRVITSQGEERLGTLNFRKVFSTDKVVKNERVFEVDLTRQLPTKFPVALGNFSGDVIRYVGVGVINSDFGKAREVTQAQYEALASTEQGDIEYFRQEASGRLRLLEGQEDWDALEGTAKQGPRVFYRRELPRLAEVEVWSLGDNVGLGTLERGGSVSSFESNGAESVVVDGDIHSVINAPFWPAQGGYNPDKLLPSEPNEVERELVIDLAGSFFVDQVNVVQASNNPPGAFQAYRLQVSDGSTNAGGSLAWKTVGALANITGNQVYHGFTFPLTKINFFSFTYRVFVGGGRHGLSEIQLFGEGYMPESQITSVFAGDVPFIELGRNAQNLTSIEWDADIPPGTDLIIRTQTGNTVTSETLYYKKDGTVYEGTPEESQKAYEDNKKFFGESSVGPVITRILPGSDWSGWSQRYFNSGDLITSPSPRRFVSVQATFLTDDPLASATLRSLTLNFVDPVARAVVGEIVPPRLDQIGVNQEFTYFIQPTFETASRGFDDILIEAPVGVEMKFKQVKVDITGQESQTYTAESEGFEIISDASDSLWVHLPTAVKTTSETALIAVQFDATIFDFATFFNGSISNSSFENSWQRVDEGDANGIIDSEKTVILALEGKQVLGDIEMGREIITPNGDGANDEMAFSFSLMRVGAGTPLLAQIYDLSGRLVRQLRDAPVSAGRHTVQWTGVDDAGELVPPGIYILRVDIDTDSDAAENTLVSRLIHVVY